MYKKYFVHFSGRCEILLLLNLVKKIVFAMAFDGQINLVNIFSNRNVSLGPTKFCCCHAEVSFNGTKTALISAMQPQRLRFCWALPDHLNYSHLCCYIGSTPRKYWMYPFSSNRNVHRQQYLVRPYTHSFGSTAKHHSLQQQKKPINSLWMLWANHFSHDTWINFIYRRVTYLFVEFFGT